MLWAKRRMGLRISLGELGDAKHVLVAGNCWGNIFLIRPSGSAAGAKFAQPKDIEKATLAFSKLDQKRWGTLFAPVLSDWDGDGKVDLIVGEGSSSANNVHLFLNTGSNASPSSNLEYRSVLALGEGRQQLTPTVFDFNDGDGKNDVVVSDDRGKLTVYLRPSAWKKGEALKPSGYLSKVGGLTNEESQALSLGSSIHTISGADLNGDGLVDLAVGKPNGRIAWMANRGTKESPKFKAPVDLAGEKASPPS